MLTVSHVMGVGFRGAFRRFDDDDDVETAVFVVAVDDDNGNDDSTEDVDVVTMSACNHRSLRMNWTKDVIKKALNTFAALLLD